MREAPWRYNAPPPNQSGNFFLSLTRLARMWELSMYLSPNHWNEYIQVHIHVSAQRKTTMLVSRRFTNELYENYTLVLPSCFFRYHLLHALTGTVCLPSRTLSFSLFILRWKTNGTFTRECSKPARENGKNSKCVATHVELELLVGKTVQECLRVVIP
jgi:hypothetical protein